MVNTAGVTATAALTRVHLDTSATLFAVTTIDQAARTRTTSSEEVHAIYALLLDHLTERIKHHRGVVDCRHQKGGEEMTRSLLLLLLLISISTATAQGRAFKDVEFGDSFPTVADKLSAYSDVMTSNGPFARAVERGGAPEDLLRYALPYVMYGDLPFLLNFDFYDGKLFRVRLSTPPVSAIAFETEVRRAHSILVDLISAAHGAPSSETDVGFLDLRAGHMTVSHRWQTSENGIEYRIGLGSTSSRYLAALWIEWTWLADLYREAVGLQERDAILDAAGDF